MLTKTVNLTLALCVSFKFWFKTDQAPFIAFRLKLKE